MTPLLVTLTLLYLAGVAATVWRLRRTDRLARERRARIRLDLERAGRRVTYQGRTTE